MELNKLKDEPYRASRLISVKKLNSGSGSDMDLGYDSNEEIRSLHQDHKDSDKFDNQMLIKHDNLLLEQHSYDEGESVNCSSSSGVSDNNGILAVAKQCYSGKQLQIDSLSVHSEAESNQAPLQIHQIGKELSNNQPLIGLGPWYAVIAYDACVRLCLKSWAKGYDQAVLFLNNECKLLREAFSLKSTLLQSEEEVLSKQTSELVSQVAGPRHTKTIGKFKIQVRKVKMFSEPSFGCKLPHFDKIDFKSFQYRFSSVKARLNHSIRNRSFTRKGFEYVQIGGSSKSNGSPSSSFSNETVQEKNSCLMRLKSADEDDLVQMQPGLDETQTFSPENLEDDLHIIVQDSRGRYCGRVLAQIASFAENLGDKLSWWPIYEDPDEKPVGKMQLLISYSTSQDNGSHHKFCMVTETVAYDVVLETAMKVQGFQPRHLVIDGHWKWLVDEFAAFYGVSDSYTKLRYLSYVMEIATPTSDCLSLVHDLIFSIISCGSHKMDLSHKENRILGEVLDKLEQILSVVFENYKSLDESSCSGLADGFGPPTGLVSPALAPAVKLYTLIHDEFSSEAQLKLCRYFQAAAKKRSRMYLKGANELMSMNEKSSSDNITISTAYMKMKSLCLSMKDEIYTDKEIHSKNVLPSFLDLPNITSSIYNMDLQTRLCTFLKPYPPNLPSPSVIEFVVTLADFQKDISSWNINPIKGGINANELFGTYISNWIKDTRLNLLGLCVKDKACRTTKWPDVRGQTRTNSFIDNMFDQLKNTINVYEDIISRFPNFALPLEKAIADVQNAVVEALDRNYAEFLSPLKENLSRFGFKQVQRLTKRAEIIYNVPPEVSLTDSTPEN
ncbi:hypothetical protein V2J09_001957 [Rumex salicifolius]